MRNLRIPLFFWMVVAALAAGCSAVPGQPGASAPGDQPTALVTLSSTATDLPTVTPSLSPTATNTATPTPSATPSPTSTPSATPTPSPAVLIGAGDIAFCGEAPEYQADERTAELIETLIAGQPQAQVFTTGDNVYGEGRLVEFRNCFDPSWGRFKERIRPVPGNHDYYVAGGAPYFEYFGAAAGPPGQGYYSYELGDWLIVALNSNCNDIACGPNSPQVQWLQETLAGSDARCRLAYWHHPRFSSGLAGGNGITNPFWRTAVELGVDVVIGGHDHSYERIAPLNAAGEPDPAGARQFIVGTGGAHLRPFGEVHPQSEARIVGQHGVIRFELYPERYTWTFYAAGTNRAAGTGEVLDSGSGDCH